MANYSLILDTKFKPFSYQEMLAPVAAATQAHQALEDAYGELSAQAKTWGQYADEQTDPETYKMYKTYADDLEMQAEQLMRYGLSPSSRREMLNLRARYGEEIAPIEAAYKRREALAAEQRKLYGADKTLRFERDASTISLDDFIKNPSLDYGESYSGALLTSQVSNAVAAYQRALTDPGKLEKLGLPFQYERALQYGATPEQVLAAIQNDAQQGDSEAVKFLRGIVDQALISSGVADWADDATLAEFRAFANRGLNSAIGTTQIQNYTDSYGMQNSLAKAAEGRAVARAKKKAKEEEARRNAMYDPDPTTFYGKNEVDKENKEFADRVAEYRKKGYLTSNYELTDRGRKAFDDAYIPSAKYGPNQSRPSGDYRFKQWAISNGMYESGPYSGIGRFNSTIQSKMQGVQNNTLPMGTPNVDMYRVTVPSDSQKTVAGKITANSGGIIYKAEDLYVDNKGQMQIKGGSMTNEEFEALTTKYPIQYIGNIPAVGEAGTQVVVLTNGDKFIIPAGTIGNINQSDLNIANMRAAQGASDIEKLTEINRGQSYVSTLLNTNKGSNVTLNDGVVYW